MATAFNESYYLKSKLAQLAKNGQSYTEDSLKAAIENAGMTIEEHYQKYSTREGTSANPYFNTTEYLEAKLAQLNSIQEGGHSWTMQMLIDALDKAHLTAEQHYQKYGCKEMDADGKLINPSNAFDANAYVAAKLAQLQATDPENWAGKTASDVWVAIVRANLSPVSHYEKYGAAEANASGIAMVQTVPVVDRVANDPLRDMMDDNVPSNYNASTAAPASVSKGVEVTKPADMGGLADESISPEVVNPESPVATPSDPEYVEVPGNGITDTNEQPVVLVEASVTDANGNEVTVAQYGVETKEGIVQPVNEKGAVDNAADPIQTTTTNEAGEMVTTTNVSDGDNTIKETTTQRDGGSTTTTEAELADGSKVAGTTETAIGSGGIETNTISQTVTNPDGSTVETAATETKAGTTTTTESTVTSKDKDGNVTGSTESTVKETANANGSTTTKTDATVKDADGKTVETIAETATTVKASDGSTTTTTTGTSTDANGNVTKTNETVTANRDAATGATTTDTAAKTTNPDGSVVESQNTETVAKAADGTTTTQSNGTTTTTDASGNTSSVATEATKVENPDGSGTETATTTATAADGSTVETTSQATTTVAEDGTKTTESTTEAVAKDASGETTSTTTTEAKTTESPDGTVKTESTATTENADGTKEEVKTSEITNADGSSEKTTETSTTDADGNTETKTETETTDSEGNTDKQEDSSSDDSGSGSGSGGSGSSDTPTVTFSATVNDSGAVEFGGNATGNITVAVDDPASPTTYTFTRGGIARTVEATEVSQPLPAVSGASYSSDLATFGAMSSPGFESAASLVLSDTALDATGATALTTLASGVAKVDASKIASITGQEISAVNTLLDLSTVTWGSNIAVVAEDTSLDATGVTALQTLLETANTVDASKVAAITDVTAEEAGELLATDGITWAEKANLAVTITDTSVDGDGITALNALLEKASLDASSITAVSDVTAQAANTFVGTEGLTLGTIATVTVTDTSVAGAEGAKVLTDLVNNAKVTAVDANTVDTVTGMSVADATTFVKTSGLTLSDLAVTVSDTALADKDAADALAGLLGETNVTTVDASAVTTAAGLTVAQATTLVETNGLTLSELGVTVTDTSLADATAAKALTDLVAKESVSSVDAATVATIGGLTATAAGELLATDGITWAEKANLAVTITDTSVDGEGITALNALLTKASLDASSITAVSDVTAQAANTFVGTEGLTLGTIATVTVTDTSVAGAEGAKVLTDLVNNAKVTAVDANTVDTVTGMSVADATTFVKTSGLTLSDLAVTVSDTALADKDAADALAGLLGETNVTTVDASAVTTAAGLTVAQANTLVETNGLTLSELGVTVTDTSLADATAATALSSLIGKTSVDSVDASTIATVTAGQSISDATTYFGTTVSDVTFGKFALTVSDSTTTGSALNGLAAAIGESTITTSGGTLTISDLSGLKVKGTEATDTFVVTSTDKGGTIEDFKSGTDKIGLGSASGSAATATSVENLTASTNLLVDTAENIKTVDTTTATVNWAYVDGNELMYDSDGDWTTTNDQSTVVTLSGVADTDFIIG